ncbi:hypothetical protein ACH0BF_19545 [Pseudobacillus sp. 179-B 2D1 NHS]|uniref:hypothetical protein n=1 Tax=Pseudobacillus sp. 179-B 2D1 NHS TaxID=3374292 RepID=UPI00387A75E8
MIDISYLHDSKAYKYSANMIRAVYFLGPVTDLLDQRINTEDLTDLLSEKLAIAKNRARKVVQQLLDNCVIKKEVDGFYNCSATRYQEKCRSFHYLPNYEFFDEKKKELLTLSTAELKVFNYLISRGKPGTLYHFFVEKMYKTKQTKHAADFPHLHNFGETQRILARLIQKDLIHLRFTDEDERTLWIHQDNIAEVFPKFLSYCGKKGDQRKQRFHFGFAKNKNAKFQKGHPVYIRINPVHFYHLPQMENKKLNELLFPTVGKRKENKFFMKYKVRQTNVHERMSSLWDIQKIALSYHYDFLDMSEGVFSDHEVNLSVREELYIAKENVAKLFGAEGIRLYRQALGRYFQERHAAFPDELEQGIFVKNLISYYLNPLIREELLELAKRFLNQPSVAPFMQSAYDYLTTLPSKDHLLILSNELEQSDTKLPSSIEKKLKAEIEHVYAEANTLGKSREDVMKEAYALRLSAKPSSTKPIKDEQFKNKRWKSNQGTSSRTELLPYWFNNEQAASEIDPKELPELLKMKESLLEEESLREKALQNKSSTDSYKKNTTTPFKQRKQRTHGKVLRYEMLPDWFHDEEAGLSKRVEDMSESERKHYEIKLNALEEKIKNRRKNRT